jgi:hypothetical protein
LIRRKDDLQVLHAFAEAGGRFLERDEDAAQFALQRRVFVDGTFAFLQSLDLGVQIIDARREFFDRLDHRLDALGAQTELLDQADGAATATGESEPSVPTLRFRDAPVQCG